MMGLRRPTDAAWARSAVEHTDELLIEQAHLEKKAASAALSFLFRYPDHESLLRPLSELAREELEHFELVVAEMRRRGIPPARLQPSSYMEELLQIVRREEPLQLLDRLLCNAVIEARSCERMHVLAEALEAADPELAAFYRTLVASEARHNSVYLDLARGLFDEVDGRLAEILDHEAVAIESADGLPRLHGGAWG